MTDFSKEDGELLKRLIRGALTSTIQTHGPITPEFVTSATKRVYGALKQYSQIKKMRRFVKTFWKQLLCRHRALKFESMRYGHESGVPVRISVYHCWDCDKTIERIH